MSDSSHKHQKIHLVFFGIIIFIAVAIAYTVIRFYFEKFNGSLASDQAIWGTFGDFIGGTLNPVFGFMSLLAILYTLNLQIREMALTREQLEKSATALSQSKDIADAELDQIKKEEKKNDLNRVIKDYYDDINESMEREIQVDAIKETHKVRHFFSDETYLLGKNNNRTVKMKNSSLVNIVTESDKIDRDYKNIYMLYISARFRAKSLKELYVILREYEEISNYKNITFFYKKRLRNIATFLNRHGYLDDDILEFYKESFVSD